LLASAGPLCALPSLLAPLGAPSSRLIARRENSAAAVRSLAAPPAACWLAEAGPSGGLARLRPSRPVVAGSASQPDQEPGYSAASTPTTPARARRRRPSRRSRSTPRPAGRPPRPARRTWRPGRRAAGTGPRRPRLAAVGAFRAPGMCPATGSTGSVSPR
jgi:hypothetical protein